MIKVFPDEYIELNNNSLGTTNDNSKPNEYKTEDYDTLSENFLIEIMSNDKNLYEKGNENDSTSTKLQPPKLIQLIEYCLYILGESNFNYNLILILANDKTKKKEYLNTINSCFEKYKEIFQYFSGKFVKLSRKLFFIEIYYDMPERSMTSNKSDDKFDMKNAFQMVFQTLDSMDKKLNSMDKRLNSIDKRVSILENK